MAENAHRVCGQAQGGQGVEGRVPQIVRGWLSAWQSSMWLVWLLAITFPAWLVGGQLVQAPCSSVAVRTHHGHDHCTVWRILWRHDTSSSWTIMHRRVRKRYGCHTYPSTELEYNVSVASGEGEQECAPRPLSPRKI